MDDSHKKPDSYWKEKLSPEQYQICRLGGTERAFSGEFYDHKEAGEYLCVCCETPLFSSQTKYDSGSGWPSYFAPVSSESVRLLEDNSHGMRRTEVRCQKCDSHLGHVFEDGPKPSGKRFCINSASLTFKKT